MKQIKTHHLNHKKSLNHQFKLSGIALIMTTTLIGYGINPTSSVMAKESADVKADTHLTSEQALEKQIQQAKEKIKKLKNIKRSEKRDAIQKMEKAKSIEEAKVILGKAENDDNRLSEQQSVSANTQIEDSNITEDNHESYEDKKDISDNQKHVTDHQEKTVPSEKTDSSNLPEQENNQTQNAHDRITSENSQQNLDQLLDKIDALSNEVDGGKLKNDNKALRDTGDNQEQQNEVAKSTNSTGEKNQAEKNTPEKTSRSDHDAPQPLEKFEKEIDKVTTKQAKNNDNLDDYVATKEAKLQTLTSMLSERDSISKENKSKMAKEIKQVEQNLNEQHDIVLDQLKSVDNKDRAVKDIINRTFDDRHAQSILERIDTEGKTNQQIANQVISQLDGLSTTSSDDILQAMFDKTGDKQALVKTILSTHLNDVDASRIAEKIMRDNPDNEQIVALLKQNFGDNVTSDDILETLLDQSEDKRQALETMLASKLNDAKAQALADVIAKKEDAKHNIAKHNIVDLMKSGLDQQLNDLLKVDKDISNFRDDIHGIFEPLKNTPSIADTLDKRSLNKGDKISTLLDAETQRLQKPSLLSGLFSGDSLLDGVRDIPNPSPGRALSIGESDGFLSGLFDDEGNFSLPDAGTVMKKSTIPVGIVLLIVGGGLIWFAKRKQSKKL